MNNSSVMIYDATAEVTRPATQDDITEIGETLLWQGKMREIVAKLVAPGAMKVYPVSALQALDQVLVYSEQCAKVANA